MLNAVPIPLFIFEKNSLEIAFINQAFSRSVNVYMTECNHPNLQDLTIWRDATSKNEFLAYIVGINNRQGKEFSFKHRARSFFTGWVLTNPISTHPSLRLVAIIDPSQIQDRHYRLIEELRLQATTDPLTKIPNRRYFLEIAEKTLQEALQREQPLALILFDFDALKSINDSYGHCAGDQALIQFSQKILHNIREGDLFGRFGGDEFLLLLPQTDPVQAKSVVKRLTHIVNHATVTSDNKSFSFSVSSGIAGIQSPDDKIGDLIRRADIELYNAKDRKT